MRKIIILLVFLCFYGLSWSQSRFEVTPEIKEAYQSVLDLRLGEAQTQINQVKTNDPDNVLAYHVENYIDFFKVFINEEKEEYERLLPNKDIRLAKVKSGDPHSPYFKFAEAEILLQWLLLKSKFDGMGLGMLGGISDLNRAYRLLEKNDKEFPDFETNKKSLAILHAMAEYAPTIFKKAFSVKGSLKMGTNEIAELSIASKTQDIMFEPEVNAIHAYMLMYLLNEKEAAWQVLQDSKLDPKNSLLATFLFASISEKTGRNETTINILENRPKSEAHASFHYLDLVMGKAKLNKLDPAAGEYINKFINSFKGIHYIKDAYQKLAWYELVVNEDEAAYKRNMKLCESKGKDNLSDDKQALKEAKAKRIPSIPLLRARLLYDGGYYNRAYDELIKEEAKFLADKNHTEEYHYRLGRILDALKDYDKAVIYYNKTIQLGKAKNSFFACNAALQAGLFFEKSERERGAKKYFEICRKIDSPIYKDDLHKKAKAGLERLSSQ